MAVDNKNNWPGIPFISFTRTSPSSLFVHLKISLSDWSHCRVLLFRYCIWWGYYGIARWYCFSWCSTRWVDIISYTRMLKKRNICAIGYEKDPRDPHPLIPTRGFSNILIVVTFIALIPYNSFTICWADFIDWRFSFSMKQTFILNALSRLHLWMLDVSWKWPMLASHPAAMAYPDILKVKESNHGREYLYQLILSLTFTATWHQKNIWLMQESKRNPSYA